MEPCGTQGPVRSRSLLSPPTACCRVSVVNVGRSWRPSTHYPPRQLKPCTSCPARQYQSPQTSATGPVSRMLTRSAAEQGYGKLADGENGSSTTKLPKLPGASSSLSPGGGSDDAAAPPGGSASGRKKHGSLRGGGGGAERFPS